MISNLLDTKARYSALESWSYDRLIAPAVLELFGGDEIGRVMSLPQGARVLDVGCGGGHALAWIAERRPDLRLTGVDLSDEQITRARARLGSHDTELVVGSALDLPFPDESFDATISIASIKHWPDPARGVRETLRVTGRGGAVLIVEADRSCTLDDATAFVKRWRGLMPVTVRLAFFRTWVAGQAFDLDEARAFVENEDVQSFEVRRIPGAPGLAIDVVR